MKCFSCKKRTDNYSADKRICAACREVLKVDLVKMVLSLDRVYLSEKNRNKNGRKQKLTATQKNDIYHEYRQGNVSMNQLAKKYGVSRTTIYNAVHNKA